MNGALLQLRQELERVLPSDLLPFLDQMDGGPQLAEALPKVFPPSQVGDKYEEAYRPWEASGLYLLNSGRVMDAHAIFWGLYDHLLQNQVDTGSRHSGKATPLIWLSQCHDVMGHPALSQRFLMLALCEDAINCRGPIPPQSTGVLYRLRHLCGMSDTVIQGYASRAYGLFSKHPQEGVYPEWILLALQEGDDNWMTAVPSPSEALIYLPNRRFLQHLLGRLGTRAGKAFEELAAYLLAAMPGCRTSRRRRTASTDYDVICCVEGLEADFRSELGRYFVCECKDWDRKVRFAEVAKFCRVLQGIRSRFGIIFAKNGITGEGRRREAALEVMNMFKETGTVVVVVNARDLEAVASGANFISILRRKYERVRLGLDEGEPPRRKRAKANGP